MNLIFIGCHHAFISSLLSILSEQGRVVKGGTLAVRIMFPQAVFPGAMGRALTRAFELRQGGDYKEFFTPQREETEILIGEAESFMVKIQEFLASREGL